MTSATATPERHIASRVAKNTVAQLVATASTIVSKLLITIIVARVYGPEQVGNLAFVLTFTMLFTFLSSAGLSWAMIRESATRRHQIHRYADNGLALVAMASLATIPLMVGIVALMGYSVTLRLAVGLAGLALAFDSMAQLLNGLFGGLERMELGAAIILVQELSFLIIGAAVVLLRLPFIWLFTIYVPSKLAGLVTGLLIYHRLFQRLPRPRLEHPFAGQLLRTALPYAANMALGPVYVRIDVVLLSLLQGNVAVGLYEAATNIFYRFNILARTLNTALLPPMARESEHQTESLRRYINAAVKLQAVVGIPITVFCIILANRLMQLIYGQNFAASGLVFGMLATITTLRFLDHTLATVLTAIGKQSQRSLAVASAAVFNISVNLVLIPRYGLNGAALTTILTEICFFALLYRFLSHRLSQPLAWHVALKPSLAGGLMALALWLLRGLPLLPVILLSLLVYLVALLSLGTFTRRELALAGRITHLHRLIPQNAETKIEGAGQP